MNASQQTFGQKWTNGKKRTIVQLLQIQQNSGNKCGHPWTILDTFEQQWTKADKTDARGEVYRISDRKEPNVLDVIENGGVELIINTPSPGNSRALSYGYLIRRKAGGYGVPMITNLELANTLANMIKEH
jgi:hypothetical protein